jgi:ABC-type lipoprotein export system ATPase subunit
MNDLTPHPKVTSPLLESFELFGLNGYKNVSLRLEKNVKIVTAENGSGKTTLLNALYALLTGKAGRLLAIDFVSLVIKFSGQAPISVKKSDLFLPLIEEFARRVPGADLFDLLGISEQAMYRIKESELSELLLLATTGTNEDFENCVGFKHLLTKSPFQRNDIKELCARILAKPAITPQYAELTAAIKLAMGNVSVLYLPTYRRIEVEFPEFQSNEPPPPHKTQDDWDVDRLIFFGLKDVDRRLKAITADIRLNTLNAYSRSSGQKLDQLLDAGPSVTERYFAKVDVPATKIVMARLVKTDTPDEKKIVELIETGEIHSLQHAALRSFLGQLLDIYQVTQEYAQDVETFINVIDSYWEQPSSEKRFIFDKLTVEAQVINSHTKKPLSLGALSSGEKQIVSIFARLYLDAGKKYLILIDEPELSLSMEWQQKFLPDVLDIMY